MAKVLIVDDEAIICTGLKSMIESLHRGDIEEVRTAYSKEEALGIARSWKPDVVVTDIRLDGATGLDLIRELEPSGRRMRFIVLSGYDCFDYAKEALRLGVTDYLLKPASLDELEKALENAMGSLDRQRELEEGSSQEYQRLVAERRLNSAFLADQRTVGQIRADLAGAGIDLTGPWFCVGVARPGRQTRALEFGADVDLVGLAGEAGMPDGCRVTAFFNSGRDFVLLYDGREPSLAQHAVQHLEAFGRALQRNGRPDCSIALSDTAPGPESVFGLHNQCQAALEYRMLYPCCHVIPCRETRGRSDDAIFLGREITELVEFVSSARGSTGEISDFIDRLFKPEALVGHSIGSIRMLYQRIVYVIGMASLDDKLIQGAVLRDFNDFESLAELRIYLKETVSTINGLIRAAQKERTIVDFAKRYVKDNYSKDISLTVMANIVSMNYSYFSKLFKSQAGVNFTDYINKVRMEAAKKLLDVPTNSVGEVAVKVGYQNPKHFARAFKNYAGVSPSAYQSGGSS